MPPKTRAPRKPAVKAAVKLTAAQKKKIKEEEIKEKKIKEVKEAPLKRGGSGVCVDGAAPKRRLFRRDTEDQATRAIDAKLGPKFSKSSIYGNKNNKGLTIMDVTCEKLHSIKNSSTRIGSAFWNHVIREFNLGGVQGTDGLSDPEEDETCREEVYACIKESHAKNPIERKTIKQERYLATTNDDLNYKEIYGLIGASVESLMIKKNASTKLLLSIVCYFARITPLNLNFGSMPLN